MSGPAATELSLRKWLLLCAPFLVVVLLNLVGGIFPSILTWGSNVWSVLPRTYLYAAVLAYIVICFPPLALSLFRAGQTASMELARILNRLPRWLRIAALAGALFSLFYLFRSEALVYGDGYRVVAGSELALEDMFLGIHQYLKPVTVLIYSVGHAIFSDTLHLPSVDAFSITSAIAGVIGVFGLMMFISEVTDSNTRRAFMFFVALTSNCVMLFSGHVELYTWATAALLWTLYFSARRLHGQSGAAPLLCVALLMVGLNVALLPLALAIVLLVLGSSHSEGRLPSYLGRFTPTQVLVSITLVSGLLALLLESIGYQYVVVGLTPQSQNPYWALSLAHLSDMLNIVIAVGSLGLFLLISGLSSKRSSKGQSDHLIIRLLVYSTIIPFLVAFWVDPELGAVRDWDLLSSFGFPLSLLGAYAFSSGFKLERHLRFAVVLAAALAAFLLVPRLYETTHPHVAAERIDSLVWQDAHYQENYRGAERAFKWGTLLHTYAGRLDLARKYYTRRLNAEPGNDLGWYNLGVVYQKQGQFDSARVAFGKAYAMLPEFSRYRIGYAWALANLGKYGEAVALTTSAGSLDSVDIKTTRDLGTFLIGHGRITDALTVLRYLDSLNPNSYLEKGNLGSIYYLNNKPDSALVYLGAASRLVKPSEACELYDAMFSIQFELGRLEDAESTLSALEENCPGWGNLAGYRNQLLQAK